jgi:hypothetical protein
MDEDTILQTTARIFYMSVSIPLINSPCSVFKLVRPRDAVEGLDPMLRQPLLDPLLVVLPDLEGHLLTHDVDALEEREALRDLGPISATFLHLKSTNVRNRLECLSQAGLSSLFV